MTLTPILRSDRPITHLSTTGRFEYLRLALGPSSWAGRQRVFTRDGTKVCSVTPDGTIVWNDPDGHDGGYEAARMDGNRCAYDYDELTVPPVVFDVVLMAEPA